MDRADRAGVPRRLHWSSMLSTLGASVRGMWSLAAGSAYFAASGQWVVVASIACGALILSVVGAVLRWRMFTFTVGSDEIRIDSGLLHRKHRSIPFDRILDVDIGQGPVARLLKVAKLKLETGGGGGKDEGVLAAVAVAEAEALRHLVRSRRSAALEPEPAVRTETPAQAGPVYAMPPRRVLLAGVFNFSLALFAALAGLFQTFDDLLNINPFSRGFWVQVGGLGGPVADLVLAHRIVAIVAGLLLVGLLGLATGLTRTILRDWGFRVDRTEAGLRRRRGLFTRSDVTLQLRRIQAAVVGSGPVRSAFGWSALKLQSLAQDEEGRDDHVVAPLATAAEIDGLLTELRFGPIADVTGWQRVSKAYVISFLVLTIPLYLLAAGFALASPLLGLAVAMALTAAQLLRWFAWRRTAFVLDGQRLSVRRGWWRRRVFLLPLRNIQTIDVVESFVTRRFGTASLAFGVAGGSGHVIHALPREKARQVRAELLSVAA